MINQKMFKIQRKLIIKSKKLTNNEKFKKLVIIYKDYFNTQIKADVDMEMGECVLDAISKIASSKEEYKKLYIDNYNNIMNSLILVKSVEFMKDIEKLQDKGLNENNINSFLITQLKSLKTRLNNYDGNINNHPEVVYNAVQIANYITDSVVQDELMLK